MSKDGRAVHIVVSHARNWRPSDGDDARASCPRNRPSTLPEDPHPNSPNRCAEAGGEQSVRDAMASFLDKLHLLAMQGGNPAARRIIKSQNGDTMAPGPAGNFGTLGVTYGFRSLAPENAGDSPFREGATKTSSSHPPSDLCIKCNLTVEEDCVRLGTYQRWHSHCVQCAQCGKVAAAALPKESAPKNGDDKEGKDATGKDQPPKLSTARRPPANVGWFVYDPDSKRETTSFGEVPTVILCTDHGHGGCQGGFQAVQRLEQYAFLLNVALRRLYLLLKKQGVVPLSPGVSYLQPWPWKCPHSSRFP